MIIAIDGHSSCGKSTIAKALAKRLSYTYVDTGAMYRAVTLFCQRQGLLIHGIVDEERLKELISHVTISFVYNNHTQQQETYLNGENVEQEIRSLEVANDVSKVSRIGFVREYLIDMQREYGRNSNVVMDGRDIGTVVFPNAEYKFFVTASAEIRAERRYKELLQKNENVDYAEVLKNIEERDRLDTSREISPLKQAEDAILVDTSHMTREGQLEWILKKIK